MKHLLGALLLLVVLTSSTHSQHASNCLPGRTVIVHLFEWKFSDIAAECERWLGPKGYCGVQVSPVNEHRILTGVKRFPWYQRYQPVSYKLTSRSGNETEFSNMVARCNNAGVRIYVDAVINHMTADGRGLGTAGSTWDADSLQFPGVPFTPTDFNCCNCASCSTPDCNIRDYRSITQVRNCRLLGLRDLKLEKEYVRGKVVDFMNRLISHGVAGFRIDAAKHMWPAALETLYGRLQQLDPRWFPQGSRPSLYQEVIDMGGEPIKASQYTHLGRVTEFKYGKNLGDVIRKNNNLKLKSLKDFEESWGLIRSENSLSFVDNHDNQRGHGAGGFGSILTFFEKKMYKIATAFTMAWPYGQVRIMSSYFWDRNIQGSKDVNDWIGPPSEQDGTPKDVLINGDDSCGNGWVCEHRWPVMYKMAEFSNVAGDAAVTHWWDNGNNQLAFSRENKAFLAINNDDKTLDDVIQTGLEQGIYCDVITGEKQDGRCTGRVVKVDTAGRARVQIEADSGHPYLAVHVQSKLE